MMTHAESDDDDVTYVAYRDGVDFVVQVEATVTEWMACEHPVEVRQ